MADQRALILTSAGVRQEIADADTLLVGAGVKTGTGNLTITAAASIIFASAVQFAANIGLTAAAGTSAFDFSGGSGIFKTSTGAVTIGPGAIALSGDATLSAGKTLDGSAGTVKLNTQFYIGAGQTSTNVTAPNLGTLTAGAASDADALHTHSGLGTKLKDTGLTLWGTPAAGEVGYMTGTASTLAKAQANAAGTARFWGVYDGTAGQAITNGVVSMLFESGLTSLTAGAAVFLSSTVAGRVTKTAPTAAGTFVFQLGWLKDGAGYDNTNGSAHACKIDIQEPTENA